MTARAAAPRQATFRLLEQALLSGRDLPAALAASAASLPSSRARSLVSTLSTGLSTGRRVSDVLDQPLFGLRPHELALVRLGERASRLPEAFSLLQKDAEDERRRRARGHERLLPALCSGLGLWLVTMGLALAPLEGIAELVTVWSASGPPPTAATRGLLFLSRHRDALVPLLAVLPLLLLISYRTLRGVLPASRVSELDARARQARTLALLVEAGVPFEEARSLSSGVSGVPPATTPTRFRPGLDARALAEGLRAEASFLGDEAERHFRLALVRGSALLAVVTGAGVLLVAWTLLFPLLSLLLLDPF